MSLDDVPARGTPVHQTVTGDASEDVTLDQDYPAVEVMVKSGEVHFTVDGSTPDADSGHYVGIGGALALRVRQSGATVVKVFAIGTDADVIVTGLL